MKKILISLIFIFFLTTIFALCVGSDGLNLWDLNALLRPGFERDIILNLRVPKILAAILSGAILAISGVIMQSLMKNPLASPFTLGISNSAAFGAAVCLVFFRDAFGATIGAFLATLVCMGLILLLSSRSRLSSFSLILAGIAFGSLFHSLTMLIQFFVNETDAAAILFWTFGDLSRSSAIRIGVLTITFIGALSITMFNHWKFDALAFGDENAISRGINIKSFRFFMLLLGSFLACLVVSFFGIIGFVGLVSPHIAKFFSKRYDSLAVLPLSALVGAILLLLSNTISALIIAPVVIPVGIITSLVGVPIIIALLVRGVK